MNHNKRYLIIGFILECLVMSVAGVYAAVTILASNISYSNSKTSAANVEDALNELYDKVPSSTYKDPILNGADPVLPDDLLPVIIDSNGIVTYVNKNGTWYNYENKMWANAIKLMGSPSKTYKEGDIISESDISAYFVWIPRYKYELWNVGVSDVTSSQVPKTISITFESKSATKSTGSTDGTYLTHPAFTFGTTELNGIWVSKFEVTGSTSAITSKPNVNSLRSTTVGSFWNALKSYDTSDTSHMMKNTEWGAVAYLTQSIYGKNSEVYINNDSSYITGCGGTTVSASSSSSCTNAYGTVTSYPQSTTGNIYGVFDMSGGAWEYVMGVSKDTNGNPYSGREAANNWNSGFNGNYSYTSGSLTTGINFPDSKYYQTYVNSTESSQHNGDALKETHGRYGDAPYFVDADYPWFFRGGSFDFGAGAGVFCFIGTDGYADDSISARVV